MINYPSPQTLLPQGARGTILIIGPSWVGDMIMAQSLLKQLKQDLPRAQIDVLAPQWTLPLLERMPEVHRTLINPCQHGEFGLRKRLKIGRQLRSQHYDWAIVLPNSWKSALIPFWTRIPLRTGWLGEYRWGLLNDIRYLDKTQWPRMVERFLALGLSPQASLPETIPKPQLTVDPQNQNQLLERCQLSDQQPMLALCPGAEYGPSKRWPPEYFSDLATTFHKRGYQVLILGSKHDADVSTQIQKTSGQICYDLTGLTTLYGAIDLLALADVVVSNDSGLMHVAAALERPLVALFGSSSPAFTPPLSEKSRILYKHLSCSPCFEKVCPLEHHRCLRQLEPDAVIQAIDELQSYESRINH